MSVPSGSTLAGLVLAAVLLAPGPDGERFDFERDRIVLTNGRELRGVVLEVFTPEHVLLLKKGNRREEVPRDEIARLDTLRERLAAFLRIRRPGLDPASEWALAEDALRVGLTNMARLQAYHVLLSDPDFAPAHELLGHERSGRSWKWLLDGKKVDEDAFHARSLDWNHRLVLDGEHFTIETNCGLRKAIDTLFDLECLYVWYLEFLGPELRAAEDVDDPQRERMTFHVHRGRDDPSFQKRDSQREPYFDPSKGGQGTNPCENIARTWYPVDGERPELLFELGTEILTYSTLVLGRTLDEDDFKLRRLSYWAEVGLGAWIAGHVQGPPGYPAIAPPYREPRDPDPAIVRASLAPIRGPHVLNKGKSELANLIDIQDFELYGGEASAPLARARCVTFVAFLLETNPTPKSRGAVSEGGRAAFWTYLREVYGTQRANASTAFEDGLGGKIENLELPWKAWTEGLPH